mmetsp:Transcript_26962/g.23806  ORF Transcript_26962/g.23806 Transcript_26962/m.23806 type:complete len:90 (+) Transcript_26962:183-452(+)
MISLFVYPIADPILVLIQILNGYTWIMVYNYIKETIMFYCCKGMIKDQKEFKDIINDKVAMQRMTKHEYPMHKLNFIQRYNMTDYFVAF